MTAMGEPGRAPSRVAAAGLFRYDRAWAWSTLVLALAGALYAGPRLCTGAACRAGWDGQILAWFAAWRGPLLDLCFGVLTWGGSVLVLLPLALGLAWRRWHGGNRAGGLLLLGGLGGATLLALAVKLLTGRSRPELFSGYGGLPADLSFPSAHTAQVVAVALACLLGARVRPGPGVVGLLAAGALLVAVSRLYLQVHYPTDLLFGALLAGCWVWALGSSLERLR